MKLGEVCIETNDVVKMSDFYRKILNISSDCRDEVRQQISKGFCPNLISGNEPINDYEKIFIGSPNWFKTLAPPVMSFLRLHNFIGKTIIPFCTHGGGGFGQIESE